MLGTGAREDTLAALRHRLGLDAPLWLRYLRWIFGVLRGDFGISYTYNVPVAELVRQRMRVSVPLAVLAILLSTAIAIPVGVFAAARRGQRARRGTDGRGAGRRRDPEFLARHPADPAVRDPSALVPRQRLSRLGRGRFGPACARCILPALALALPQAAILARVTRAAVLETLGEDYVRTARAKGLTAHAALWRHAVPNALIPVVTHHRPAILLPARRHGHHRERVHPAGARPAGVPGDRAARPDRGAGSRGAAGRQRDRGEFPGRSRLPPPSTRASAGPAHEGRMSGAWRSRNLLAGGAITALMVLIALISLVWTPYGPTQIDIVHRLAAAEPGASARHRSVRPRRAFDAHGRRAELALGRADRGRRRRRHRRAARRVRGGARGLCRTTW